MSKPHLQFSTMFPIGVFLVFYSVPLKRLYDVVLDHDSESVTVDEQNIYTETSELPSEIMWFTLTMKASRQI